MSSNQLLALQIQVQGNKLSFKVHLQPKSSVNKIIEIKEGVLYIKIQAPPVEGKANKALKKFLAKILNIKLSQISILKGEKSRNKVIGIINLKVKNLMKAIGCE